MDRASQLCREDRRSGHSGIKPLAGAAISETQIVLPVVCPFLAQETETPHFTASDCQGKAQEAGGWGGCAAMVSAQDTTPFLNPDPELGRALLSVPRASDPWACSSWC